MDPAVRGSIAGFLDGEGHVTIRRCNLGRTPNPSYQVAVGFTNRNLLPLEVIQTHYGGKIYEKARASNKHRPAFELTIFRRAETKRILSELLPDLLIKRPAAEIGLALLRLGKLTKRVIEVRGKSWPRYEADATEVAAGEDLRAQLRIVNGRGA